VLRLTARHRRRKRPLSALRAISAPFCAGTNHHVPTVAAVLAGEIDLAKAGRSGSCVGRNPTSRSPGSTASSSRTRPNASVIWSRQLGVSFVRNERGLELRAAFPACGFASGERSGRLLLTLQTFQVRCALTLLDRHQMALSVRQKEFAPDRNRAIVLSAGIFLVDRVVLAPVKPRHHPRFG
jgi:hypothetical protein